MGSSVRESLWRRFILSIRSWPTCSTRCVIFGWTRTDCRGQVRIKGLFVKHTPSDHSIQSNQFIWITSVPNKPLLTFNITQITSPCLKSTDQSSCLFAPSHIQRIRPFCSFFFYFHSHSSPIPSSKHSNSQSVLPRNVGIWHSVGVVEVHRFIS